MYNTAVARGAVTSLCLNFKTKREQQWQTIHLSIIKKNKNKEEKLLLMPGFMSEISRCLGLFEILPPHVLKICYLPQYKAVKGQGHHASVWLIDLHAANSCH